MAQQDEVEEMDTTDTPYFWFYKEKYGDWHRVESMSMFLSSADLEEHYEQDPYGFMITDEGFYHINFSDGSLFNLNTRQTWKIKRSCQNSYGLDVNSSLQENSETTCQEQKVVPSSSSAGPSTHPLQGSNVGADVGADVGSDVSAVQNTIDVLNQSLGTTSSRQSQDQTVDQYTDRSFPGVFTCGLKRHLLSCNRPAKIKKNWKPFVFSVFLLNKYSCMTPLLAEEVELMQAGLGRRYLSMPDDLTHSEVSSLFCDAYPQMKSMSGRWHLYKASGGKGRRWLNLVLPESGGYCGSTIRRVTRGGKTMLYIVPLQHEFDLSPLPSDVLEFSSMPTAERSTPDHETLLKSEPEETNSSFTTEDKSTDAECPICMKTFPIDVLVVHASVCGDLESPVTSPSRSPDIMPQEFKPQEKEMSWYIREENEEDVLRWLATQVDTFQEFRICVSRMNLLERGLLLWKRQKSGSPVNTLKITFLGEAGVDTGSLRKEFLTEMIGGIETRLFEGRDGKGKIPKYSLNDLDNGLFRVAGELFAVSLAQGGPAPRFLQDWCYDYLLNGKLENITTDSVYDTDILQLIKMIEETSDLSSYAEQIVSCGYTGPINEYNKENITRAIVMHAAAQRTLMLQQLREGLQLYRLIDVMRKNREVCRGLFVTQGGDNKVDSNYIMSHLYPKMSEAGTLKHAKEVQILNHFQDFLLELEGEGTVDEEALSVPQVMQWLTGQSHRHLLLSEREAFTITVEFDHTCMERMPSHTLCFPIVSACIQTITFPTAHLLHFNEFKENMTAAVKHGACFYRV